MIDIGSTIKIAVAMEQMDPPVTFADAGLLYDAEQKIQSMGVGPAWAAIDKAGTLDATVSAACVVINDAKKMLGNPKQRSTLTAVMASL